MSKFFKTTWYAQDIDVKEPSRRRLAGLKPAKQAALTDVMAAQDHTGALGRRVICSLNLQGEQTWHMPNSAYSLGSHPYPEVRRPAFFSKFTLTPGHILRMDVLYAPSGETGEFTGGETPLSLPKGPQGAISVDINWRTLASVSRVDDTTDVIDLDGSQLPNGSSVGLSDHWQDIRLAKFIGIHPERESLLREDPDGAYNPPHRWLPGCDVEISGYFLGSPRVIDLVISEVPWGLNIESDDPEDQWVGSCWSNGVPGSEGPVLTYPKEEIDSAGSDGDPRGIEHLMRVHHAQNKRLGPMLINWQAWNESDHSSFDGDLIQPYSYVQHSSPNFLRLQDNNSTGYDPDEPGWSLACGGYARPLGKNHDFAMENNGSIPVYVDVLSSWATAASGTGGVFRIQSSEYSWVDVDLSTGADAGTGLIWYRGYGHLRCGIGPGDPSVAQAFFMAGNTQGNLRIYAFSVHRVNP